MAATGRVNGPLQSHEQYINSLLRPSLSQSRQISEIQLRKEHDIDSKYHASMNEHDAATRIQKAYRGHRERRQLEGLTLDPSSRWIEAIKELRYRSATAPHLQLRRSNLSPARRPRTPSDVAQSNWRKIAYIAEHASAGECKSTSTDVSQRPPSSSRRSDESTMLMDIRYFLEMVDSRHRYGTNLQVYHEEWLRSRSDRHFFHWLDEGEGRYLDLPGCTRSKLDSERIRYLSKDERKDYLVEVDENGKLRWAKNGELISTSIHDFKDSMTGIVRRNDDSAVSFGDAEVQNQTSVHGDATGGPDAASSHQLLEDVRIGSDGSASEISSESPDEKGAQQDTNMKRRRKRKFATPATILNHLLRATVKPGTWIYVADTVGRLYVGIKDSGAFQHASFLSGARISSAGLIGINNGQLTYLSPLSGHYRPTTKSFRRFIGALKARDVDLTEVRVSHAYEILLGIECYGRTKKGLKKAKPHRKSEQSVPRSVSPKLDQRLHDAANNMSATDLVEEHWKRERRSTLTRLMDELHIKRKGDEVKKA